MFKDMHAGAFKCGFKTYYKEMLKDNSLSTRGLPFSINFQ